MKLGIMQPYFFPYLGYFDLLHNVDLFIVYDTVQYIKQGWINRNRVLHPNKIGWQYITIPVDRNSFHNSYRTPISDIRVSVTKLWKQHILGQLAHYEKNAPHAIETINFVTGCLAINEDSISRLNVHFLNECAKLLNLDFQYRFSSELDIELDMAQSSESRVLELCEFLRTKEYVNLPGGVNLYHPEIFESRNIRLTFRDLPMFVYQTHKYDFEPHLSIIDLLMWNEPREIKRHLDQYRGKG